MSSWIFPSNPKMYDTLGASRNLPFVYWTQRIKSIEIGDIVYIYRGSPISRIVYKSEVVDKDIPFSGEVLNDKEYWRNGYSFDEHPLTRRFIKLRPLEENFNEKLNFCGLKSHGETSYLMGGKRIMDEKYLSYVEANFGISDSSFQD